MGYWAPYVPVAKRRAQAAKHLQNQKKKGKVLNPVVIAGRQIASTFWGQAWCENLENYSDYSNRLPRGRTYVRNGSVLDLQVSKGKIFAQVMGSYLYEVTIEIKAMASSKWTALVKACSGKIDSLIELLQGKFSNGVMSIIINKENGLFPRPNEIKMECSCPDGVGMCKHTAAVLYGIGACLDLQPEKLFLLRHVDHLELISKATAENIISMPSSTDGIEEGDLSAVFGIEMAPVTVSSQKPVLTKKTLLEPAATPKEAAGLKLQKKAKVGSDKPLELSLPQAANLMKVSRAHLARLLDDQMIPFRSEGKVRWIAFEEIIKYRKKEK
jgi:uncharacterized Zn finger protein